MAKLSIYLSLCQPRTSSDGVTTDGTSIHVSLPIVSASCCLLVPFVSVREASIGMPLGYCSLPGLLSFLVCNYKRFLKAKSLTEIAACH